MYIHINSISVTTFSLSSNEMTRKKSIKPPTSDLQPLTSIHKIYNEPSTLTSS